VVGQACKCYFDHVDDAIQLWASPTLLNSSGDWVTVNWKGVSLPSKDDWVGIWVLPNSSVTIDARKRAPIKFQVQYIIAFFVG